MKKYDLTIIIVTFNSANHIVKCIDSIVKNEVNNLIFKIIIVDNNSQDETIEKIKKIQNSTKQVSLIINNKNVGFAQAVNQGINKSFDSKYVLLLNPDTIVYKNAITRLIECSKKNNAGICGGSTFSKQGDENGSYFRFPNIFVGIFDFTNFRKLCSKDKWHKYFYYLDSINTRPKEFPVDVVTGGFMLVKKSTIDIIGQLDEKFFMYLEDVDYCLRARKAGINIYHSTTSKITHIGGASSSNKDKIRHSSWLKSRKLYFLKHFGVIDNILIQLTFLIDDLFILLKLAIKS